MKCFFGFHKPSVKQEPTENTFFVSVRCDRCQKLLCSSVIAVGVTWVPERSTYGFQVGTIKVA